jgi:SAM-dependent methyltransferase
MRSNDAHQIVAHGYDAIGERYLEWSSDHTIRLAWLDTLRTAIPPPALVLDLGCGAGVPVARWLVDAGYTVTGIDIAEGQVTLARQFVPEASFAVGDMSTVLFDPASFDAIVALYSITHVARDRHSELIRRMRTWLRPGGCLLASLGAGDSPDWSGPWLGADMFFSHFDAATNRRMLEAAGFAIEHDELVDEIEDGSPIAFQWVLART